MCQCRIVLDALQFVGDNLTHVGFDTVVLLLYLLLHPVDTVLIGEVGNDHGFFI